MNTTTGASPQTLRTRMVDHIMSTRPRTAPVEQAMRKVPRHEFLPKATLEDAYAPTKAVITKRDGDGAALSCSSVPTLVATMLDQLDVRPGDRVLEIGAGTGINAAYLAELTGPSGRVTTVDIDEEVTAQARHALNATGYDHVHVFTRDGALGAPEHAPYDRIIVTVGAWDLPPAWWDQLAPGGRIVVPLRWRGQTRSIAFTHEGDHLRSRSIELCGFVPMIGQDGERAAPIDTGGHVSLYWDADQQIDPAALRDTLSRPRASAWSGATVGPDESFDGVWLRLTAAEPGTCRIAADLTAVETGLCTPAIPARSPALVDGESLAYFALRRLGDEGTTPRWELGAHGHGPAGPDLAHRLCEQIGTWSDDRTRRPTITALRSGEQPPGSLAITKQHTLLMITYR